MLMPKRVKYRKAQKGTTKGIAKRGTKISFGHFGIITLERGRITSRQIEACRLTMTRFIKKGGKIWIRIFPDRPMTKKPAETRMGKGKGAPEFWVAIVKPGRVLFEMEGISLEEAKEALRQVAHKLPVKTKFIVR